MSQQKRNQSVLALEMTVGVEQAGVDVLETGGPAEMGDEQLRRGFGYGIRRGGGDDVLLDERVCLGAGFEARPDVNQPPGASRGKPRHVRRRADVAIEKDFP